MADEEDGKGLTPRQEAFAQAFVETHNASEAYRRAYTTENSTDKSVWECASKLRATPKVQSRIEELQAEAAKRAEVTVDKIARELALIAFANMQDYMTVTEDGGAYLDLTRLSRDQAAAIAELTSDTYTERDGDERRTVKKTRIKLSDKQGALEKLGRHLGMFKDGLEISGKNGGPIEVTDANSRRDLARWIASRMTAGLPPTDSSGGETD